ncbi:hypothetical protein I302_105420 [Kwoniella bestiolae CBS 10118]|uniref:Uncharacterized protein n=1 Tax=Kwoniella bestiolae CBS 10118 TaxID=1296100 RepID=A0A1B9FT31_9TREE|nr:hypothetical protein I302_08701 [Kwoniella bestiolae CBS 10118]OCF21922.1 hypothetical protein I302_08701 [Kwoniella bestiolae CBS 10118]
MPEESKSGTDNSVPSTKPFTPVPMTNSKGGQTIELMLPVDDHEALALFGGGRTVQSNELGNTPFIRTDTSTIKAMGFRAAEPSAPSKDGDSKSGK